MSKRFALKEIYCGLSQVIESMQQEFQILSQLENEFIIFYEDSFFDDRFFYILTEYCQVRKYSYYIVINSLIFSF